MGRELRADPEGGVHHVSNRGARQYTTFIDDVDRRSFLDLVGTAAVKHEISVLAYCLMGNHYHLLVSCRSGGLSLFVHGFASAYSRRFNRDHGFSGPLNGDRFWSGVVDGDDHLITVARYIHRNPVELGFDARSYRWSSYRHYLQASGPDWLNRVPLLTASGGRQALQRIVECDVASDKALFGSATALFPREPRAAAMVDSVEMLIDAVSSVSTADAATILTARTRSARRERSAALVLAADLGELSPHEMAETFGFASVSSMRSALARARRLIEVDDVAARLVADARKVLQRST